MKASLFLVALLSYTLNVWAAQPLASLNDPGGDDNGSGALSYPQRTDYQAGDLDLLQLKIDRDEAGYWFSATFKNAIRDPKDAFQSVGAESLANFARKGFYQFNIDIYIDTDRLNGSGNTFTLPGRHVMIDSNFAWERAVILTPRPELMHRQLLDVLEEQFPKRTSTEIEASIDHSILFPTRIKVRGKTIDFFVPAHFLVGSSGTNWAVTAFVTGAITAIPADLSLINSSKTPLERLQLGVMQPAPGRPKDTLGISSGSPSPLVDVLDGSLAQHQSEDKHELTGVAWGATMNEAVMPPITDASITPIATFFQAATPVTAPSTVSSPVQTSAPIDASLARRLQTLRQLFDQKLIGEAEYRQQRERILNGL